MSKEDRKVTKKIRITIYDDGSVFTECTGKGVSYWQLRSATAALGILRDKAKDCEHQLLSGPLADDFEWPIELTE